MATAELKRRAGPRAAITLGVPCLLIMVAACQSLGVGESPRSDASMGLLIAQDNCSRCHGMGIGVDSPNEDAPPFGDIVNRPGMTQEAVAGWLRDAHNYPIEMGFHLEPHQIDSMALYMMRWRLNEPPAQ